MARRNVLSSVAFGAVLAVTFAAGPASAADPDEVYAPPSYGPHTVLFTGVDFKEDSWFGYGGGIYAFNGLGADGFALRAFAGGGEFDYFAAAQGIFPGGDVDGSSFTFDVQGGYRMFMNGLQFGVYAGVNYWDITHDFKGPGGGGQPDADAEGEEVGFKIDAEINNSGNGPLYFDARGSYSTAFDTYWARGRIGYDLGWLTIGPEGAVMGNDDYDQFRFGGFALFGLMDTGANVSVSAGYADVDGSTGDDSVYGSVGLSVAF